MTTLLTFHRHVLEKIKDPTTNDLLVIGRGLGLRLIICTLLKMYDSPKSLVLLLGASPEEETAIGEELGIMGCRRPGLRVVGYETSPKDRQALYHQGGLISVTTRILIVDMLLNQVPTECITGMLFLHAEQVNALSPEAFISGLYREKNKLGFVKAFTDQPERITSGLSPLKNIMKELHIRTVHIYPRFHEEIKESLSERKPDVVEIGQDMSEAMSDIHTAIIACMNATLSELKRSNTGLDIDDLKVENAYFRQFSLIVRRQLDAVWAKVGPKTKQLVSDLGTLRELLQALLTYDAFQFQFLIDNIIATNSYTATGSLRQNQSLWVMSPQGNIIFETSKRRCYVNNPVPVKKKQPEIIDLVDDEADWAALDEIEDIGPTASREKGKGKEKETTEDDGLPEGVVPVLEELPKWDLLAEVLLEIEGEIIRLDGMKRKPGQLEPTNRVLVLASSTRTCNLVREYLDDMDHSAPRGQKGRKMMMRKLKYYLYNKRREAEEQEAAKKGQPSGRSGSGQGSRMTDSDISEALRRKDKEIAIRNASRRRVRGGGPGSGVKHEQTDVSLGVIQTEAEVLLNSSGLEAEPIIDLAYDVDFDNPDDFSTYFGLIPPSSTVVVRPYADDMDDRMLADLKPTFIVMYEPDMDFVRRIEVYKATHPGVAVRVYHLYYRGSSEEHKYLAGLRKENDAFKRLITEKATMVLTIDEHSGPTDAILKTISTRYAGGRRDTSLKDHQPQVIVDMREFRSALPSLLHAARIAVVPATLRTGDYVLSPDICVERKSIPDLMSSFNSGRLYTQCEMMCAYYKYPILLIEFEEDKAFSLEIVNETVSYAKPAGAPQMGGANSRYGNKPNQGSAGSSKEPPAAHLMLQSKLVLLTLSFPRLRIIWSSSPYATTDIFLDLKMDRAEPDLVGAVSTGVDANDPEMGVGVNSAAEDLLRTLPGIRTEDDVRKVMRRVKNLREWCGLSLEDVKGVLGDEKGKQCWEFMHRGDKKG